MKRLTRIWLLSVAAVALIIPAFAQDTRTIRLEWDAPPEGAGWTAVKVYEKTLAGYVLKASQVPTATSVTITGVTPGRHTYVARSVSGTEESTDSNPVLTPLDVPANLRLTLELDIKVREAAPK